MAAEPNHNNQEAVVNDINDRNGHERSRSACFQFNNLIFEEIKFTLMNGEESRQLI